MSTAVEHNPAEHRYEVLVDGELGGYLEYARDGDILDLQHTVVLPTHRGQGLAGLLAERAFQDAAAEGLTVVPTCGFVAGWVREHPEVADLVAE